MHNGFCCPEGTHEMLACYFDQCMSTPVPAADAVSEAVTSTPIKMTTDRYGFLIPNEGTPGASTSASDNSPAMTKEMTRVKKWQKMLGEAQPIFLLAPLLHTMFAYRFVYNVLSIPYN